MTTGGEGGMVTCNDKTLWRKMWSYKDHGKKYTPGYEFENSPKSPWSHESFGTNCRMTEMQAAIGRIQIKRMSDWSMARIANAMAIREALLPFSGEGGVVRVPTLNGEGNLHAYYKYYTYVRPENFASGWTRDRVVDEINRLGVPCYRGSCSEIYLEKAFDGTNFRPKKRLPIAKKLGETSLMFVVHPTLTEREIDLTCIVIRDVLTKASC
jgi:dTDP-4-amino-4,6-dideoxygalactose transaminase